MKQHNIPSLRFPKFSGEWQEKILGVCGKFLGGGTPSKQNIDYWNGNIPWVSSSDISENSFQVRITRYITDEALKDSATKLIPRNSLLIVSRVGVGKVAIADREICTSQDFTNFIPDKNIDTVFAAHIVKSNSKKLLSYNQGTSIQGFTKSDLDNLKVSIPELAEQQKIASFLTSVDEWIGNLKQQKRALEQYKKGMMHKIFSQEVRFRDENGKEYPEWEEKLIGQIIVEYKQKSVNHAQFPVLTSSRKGLLLQNEYYGEDNRITDRDNTGFNVIPPEYITYRTRSDDGIFVFNENKMNIHGIVSTYYPVFKSKNVSNKFLVELLNYSWEKLFKYSVGTSQKVLSFVELKKITFFVPTDKEQQKIADFLTSLDNLIQSQQQKISHAEQWNKGLLQKMFV